METMKGKEAVENHNTPPKAKLVIWEKFCTMADCEDNIVNGFTTHKQAVNAEKTARCPEETHRPLQNRSSCCRKTKLLQFVMGHRFGRRTLTGPGRCRVDC